MTDEAPYNPLDTRNLGKSVAEALLDRDDHAIADIPRFVGSGIYVIYYTGDFELYRSMAEANADELSWPIYIGKAVPSGGRRGTNLFQPSRGSALFSRLAEHKESIEQAENLDVADFRARYLIVEDIWIPLGESLLISTFKPVWNAMLDGFGNHDPGKGRYNGERRCGTCCIRVGIGHLGCANEPRRRRRSASECANTSNGTRRHATHT